MKTETMLRKLLARIKSGEESPEECASYRHVAGEISAWGNKFAEALRIRDERKRRKSRPSNEKSEQPERSAPDA